MKTSNEKHLGFLALVELGSAVFGIWNIWIVGNIFSFGSIRGESIGAVAVIFSLILLATVWKGTTPTLCGMIACASLVAGFLGKPTGPAVLIALAYCYARDSDSFGTGSENPINPSISEYLLIA